MSVDSTSPAFTARTASTLADLWHRVSMRSEARLHQLELLISHLFDRPLKPDEIRHAQTYANELASRLGLLGIVAGAAKLRRVAQLLELPPVGSSAEDLQDRRSELAIQLATLTDETRSNAEDAAADLQLLSRGPESVLVVGAQGEVTDALLWSAASAGLAVRHLHPHLIDEIGDREADAIVQVLDDADHIADCSVLIREAYPDIPLLALSPKLGPAEQVHLAGFATLIVPRRTHPDVVTEETQRLLRAARIEPTVALFGQGSESLILQLSEHGLIPTVHSSGHHLMDAVANAETRSVICAPMPDGRAAIALLRLLRSERRGRTIVVGCVSSDPSDRAAALEAGADCFWTSQANASDMAGELAARLARSAVVDGSLTEIDDNTMVPWSIGSVMLHRLVGDGARTKSFVAFALLKLREDPDQDAQIARSFRRSDVISRRDSETLVLALRGADRSTLTRRLQGALELLYPQTASARAAVMEYPTDARSATQALDRCESALDRSAMLGGPSIVGIDWCPDFEAPPDVLVLESDHLLASTLVSALGGAGYDCVFIDPSPNPGTTENIRLNQVPPPRVLIVDVDTQSGTHLDDLRHLRRLYPAESTKLIVTADDVGLALIDHAFSIDAFDVVQKPFHLQLLVRRIQRELS